MERGNSPLSAPAERERLQMYVGGEACGSESGRTRRATSPATGEEIAEVPDGTRADVRRALQAARTAQPELAATSPFERAELCHELADAVEERFDHLVRWLSFDQGKPVAEAEYEVDGCAQLFRIAAEDVKRDDPPTLPSEDADKHVFTLREPHGVYGVVTPWNFPLTISAEYLAPGLAVGNAVVWCPAPTTSAVSLKLAETFAGTSLPDGALNVVTGDGPVVGDEVVSNDATDAVGFTGSPETGETIARNAGAKPTLLEMGGNGPVIVLDDAAVDAAAEATAAGCFTNAGQICSASERILVHESVRDEFVDELADIAADTTVGDPFDADTDMGPLNNAAVADKMDRHVADAVEKGATLVCGGERVDSAPTDLYYEPTVLDGVTPEMTVNREETFGPIAPVFGFDDRDEALEIANGIDLGLTAGVFTRSIDHLYFFAERLETGIVNVNDGSNYWEKHLPFGGHTGKRSGVGRLGGRYTIEEMSQIKNVTVDTGDLGPGGR